MTRFIHPDALRRELRETSSEESYTDTDTSTSSIDSVSPDIRYLKDTLGVILKKVLAEIVAKHPQDPIHYLAQWLYRYRINTETDYTKKMELEALMKERDSYFREKQHNELMDEARKAFWEMVRNAEEIAFKSQFFNLEGEDDNEQEFV